MPQNPGNLEKFWNELKRRKVIQVITVYAAIAFVILQLVDMVAEPLQLPDGTEALVIVLLCIGFFIAIFLSWVYDITPAGVSKTKPVKLTGQISLTNKAKSGGWKIATIISAVMITALLLFNFIRGEKRQNITADFDKTIAVLPFANDSPDKENEYFCNGMMDEILNDLQKIGDLRVKSRKSVERFRNPDQDIKEIGRQLDVSFILEGSVRKNGDNIRIATQLIDAKTGDHLWSEIYNGKYTEKIFDFQSSVAGKVATSLLAIISPDEQRRIEVRPPSDMLAHDLNLKALEMFRNWYYKGDSVYYNLALNLINQSLEVDPEYIDALHNKCTLFTQAHQYDSAMKYYEKILEIDPNYLSYDEKGSIYFFSGKADSALKYMLKEDEVDPDDPWTNLMLGQLYVYYGNEVIKALPYFQKALASGGDLHPEINTVISQTFLLIGDNAKAEKYQKKAIFLRPECSSISAYGHLLFTHGKYGEALNFLDSICMVNDCGQNCNISKYYLYLTQGDFEKAEHYYNKGVDLGYKQIEEYNVLYYWNLYKYDNLYLACLFNETGRRDEALRILKDYIEVHEDFLKENKDTSFLFKLSIINLRLATAYAIMDEKDKSFKYLAELEKSVYFEWPCSIKTFPAFNKFRNDPEFKAILKSIEKKRAAIRAQVSRMEEKGEINM